MSARSTAKPSPRAEEPIDRPAAEALPPMRPHRGWFIALSLTLAAWIVVLLAMFFTTVYPLRHSIASTHPATP